MSRSNLSAIIKGHRRINAATARALDDVFFTPPGGYWLPLQNQYDVFCEARRPLRRREG
jgi:plasmid maintenance system antidote protein VapI